jgi:predicted transcriptional regulator
MKLKLRQIRTILDADVLCGSDWEGREVLSACGADLMSDVLAFTKDRTLLITGLTNIQVVRTADVSDITAIVFVRGKRPGQEIVELAKNMDIPLLVAGASMYEACGLLYKNGLCGAPVSGGSGD